MCFLFLFFRTRIVCAILVDEVISIKIYVKLFYIREYHFHRLNAISDIMINIFLKLFLIWDGGLGGLVSCKYYFDRGHYGEYLTSDKAYV